ncbi:MAG: Universal stress protein family [Herminiimonas sp.]|jgi:nucleotide-binding universal stress UspA family protein|nr:Universal stress protein family [Herminiimonas sp.]
MKRILVPVDGSDNSLRALRYAMAMARRRPPLELCLINVQDLVDGRVQAYRSRGDMDSMLTRQAEHALEAARRLLAETRLPYTAYIAYGSPASAIADYVKAKDCDTIVMGTRGMSAINNLLLGSISTQVLHLVQVPVTLVK